MMCFPKVEFIKYINAPTSKFSMKVKYFIYFFLMQCCRNGKNKKQTNKKSILKLGKSKVLAEAFHMAAS